MVDVAGVEESAGGGAEPGADGAVDRGPDAVAAGRGQRAPGVSRAAVLAAAMRLVEQQGVAALSMRKLAAELGVAVTSIYWHVGNREALLDQLVAEMVHGLGVPYPRGTAPGERIVALAVDLREVLRGHPHLIGLVNERGLTPALFLPWQRQLVAEVAAAGLRGAAAAGVVRAVLYQVIGFVLVERHVDRSPEQRPSAEELWLAEPGADRELGVAMATPVEPEELVHYCAEAWGNACQIYDELVAARFSRFAWALNRHAAGRVCILGEVVVSTDPNDGWSAVEYSELPEALWIERINSDDRYVISANKRAAFRLTDEFVGLLSDEREAEWEAVVRWSAGKDIGPFWGLANVGSVIHTNADRPATDLAITWLTDDLNRVSLGPTRRPNRLI